MYFYIGYFKLRMLEYILSTKLVLTLDTIINSSFIFLITIKFKNMTIPVDIDILIN